MRGIAFQDDGNDPISRWLINPLEWLDRRVAGLHDPTVSEPLASHAGVHVILEDGSEVVVENLVGTAYETFEDALNWTAIDQFRARDGDGWDATIPARSFRGVDERVEAATIQRLNTLRGKPFAQENCVVFVERAFGQRLFADSPVLRRLGLTIRSPDPALPLLSAHAELDPRAESLLRANALRALPEPSTVETATRVARWVVGAAAFTAIGIVVLGRRSRRRKSVGQVFRLLSRGQL